MTATTIGTESHRTLGQSTGNMLDTIEAHLQQSKPSLHANGPSVYTCGLTSAVLMLCYVAVYCLGDSRPASSPDCAVFVLGFLLLAGVRLWP